MDADALTARVETGPDRATILIDGRIDRDGDAALAAAYAEVAAAGATAIRLDFTAVGYINSTGIALIVRLLTEARRDGRTVEAVGLSDHYREIFRITRLSDFMTILEEANA